MSRAAGLSLIEVCGVTVVVGVVTAVALTAVPGWLDGARRDAATSSVSVVLKDAQRRAVTEGRAMCVDVNPPAQTWAVTSGRCRPGREGVTFFADGSATPRTLHVGRDTLTVDAAGRVTGG